MKRTRGPVDLNSPFFGLHEAAAYLGIRPQTMYWWYVRGRKRNLNPPEPITRLRMGPLWRRMDIVKYKERLDRNGMES